MKTTLCIIGIVLELIFLPDMLMKPPDWLYVPPPTAQPPANPSETLSALLQEYGYIFMVELPCVLTVEKLGGSCPR